MVRMALLELVQTLVYRYTTASKAQGLEVQRSSSNQEQTQRIEQKAQMIDHLLQLSLVMLSDCYKAASDTSSASSASSAEQKKNSSVAHGLPTVAECRPLFLTILRTPLLDRAKQEHWLASLLPIYKTLDRDLFVEFFTLFTYRFGAWPPRPLPNTGDKWSCLWSE
ncbi:unnamed protein product [Amoebophrya sp. A25]|nr:unnamed protein product [Amoebophrya sp. A25]|eukprot:GSA25T00006628001.1